MLVLKENKGFQPNGAEGVLWQSSLLLAQVGIELQLGKLRPEYHLPAVIAGGKDFGPFNMAQPFRLLCNPLAVLCPKSH